MNPVDAVFDWLDDMRDWNDENGGWPGSIAIIAVFLAALFGFVAITQL